MYLARSTPAIDGHRRPSPPVPTTRELNRQPHGLPIRPRRLNGRRSVTMTRQSMAKAHEKIQELSWDPLYHTPVTQYGTDYTFAKAQKKDPLKQVLRSYFPMQEEKDHRVYGASDGAIRGNMFRQVQERWLEWQKLFLSIIPLPEISAARAMPLLFRTV